MESKEQTKREIEVWIGYANLRRSMDAAQAAQLDRVIDALAELCAQVEPFTDSLADLLVDSRVTQFFLQEMAQPLPEEGDALARQLRSALEQFLA